MWFDQASYSVRFEWGMQGVQHIAPSAGVAIIVDVLSFSTCLDVACGRGAVVFPYRFKDATAADFARSEGALLAGSREGLSGGGYSLSPASLESIPDGTRLVLPSPNGATLTLEAARHARVLCGCLRNSSAVTAAASADPAPVTVIACGERWPDGSLRPALEDHLGAGAVIAGLAGSKSPEAEAAEILFKAHAGRLPEVLWSCALGRELVERGFERDVHLAAGLNVSGCVPEFSGLSYRACA